MKTVYMPEKAKTKPHCHHFRSSLDKMVSKNVYSRGQVVECDHGNRFIAVNAGYGAYWSMRPLRWWRITWWKIPKEVQA